MKFSPLFFHRTQKTSARNIGASLLRFAQKRTVIAGVGALAFLFLAVLLFDGLVFYSDVIKSRIPATASGKQLHLSEQDIAETLTLLDDRQKQFDAIRRSFGPTGAASASTSVQTAPERP